MSNVAYLNNDTARDLLCFSWYPPSFRAIVLPDSDYLIGLSWYHHSLHNFLPLAITEYSYLSALPPVKQAAASFAFFLNSKVTYVWALFKCCGSDWHFRMAVLGTCTTIVSTVLMLHFKLSRLWELRSGMRDIRSGQHKKAHSSLKIAFYSPPPQRRSDLSHDMQSSCWQSLKLCSLLTGTFTFHCFLIGQKPVTWCDGWS